MEGGHPPRLAPEEDRGLLLPAGSGHIRADLSQHFKLLRSSGIDSASRCSLAGRHDIYNKSIPWNQFLGSLNVYKFGLGKAQVIAPGCVQMSFFLNIIIFKFVVKFVVLVQTVKARTARSDLCISRNETARPRSQFPHSCICGRFIYSQDRSTYFAAAKLLD